MTYTLTDMADGKTEITCEHMQAIGEIVVTRSRDDAAIYLSRYIICEDCYSIAGESA